MRFFTIFLMLLIISFSYAEDGDKKDDPKATYINVVSNLEDTKIFLDDKEIGVAPLKNFAIESHKEHTLKAINSDSYHETELTQKILLATNELQTIEFTFKPLKTEVFLVGEDGFLYLNGKFEKKLHGNNRVMKVDASPNLLFGIYNKDKQIQFKRDLKADKFTQIRYTLKNTPKEIKIYTSYLGNLIWEDTLEAVNSSMNYSDAQRYCENLEIAFLKDWRIPTLEELNTLYETYKDDIYNGYGEPFYWSSDTSIGDSGVWSYSQVKDFTVDGEVKRSVQNFDKGKVRCVHDIAFRDMNEETMIEPIDDDMEEEDQKKEYGPGEYDPNLTKDLQRFMLK